VHTAQQLRQCSGIRHIPHHTFHRTGRGHLLLVAQPMYQTTNRCSALCQSLHDSNTSLACCTRNRNHFLSHLSRLNVGNYAVMPFHERRSNATSKENAKFIATKYVILRHECSVVGRIA
jgi:hypothetical protein